MPVLFALGSAFVYGVSDYYGGRTSRRVSPIALTFVSELTLLVEFALVVPLVEPEGPSSRAVVAGLIAGICGSLGVLGLYAALSRGNMTVVAPITGVVASVFPVLAGVALGERPGWLPGLGIVAAILSVALIGGVVGMRGRAIDPATAGLAALVGLGFGGLFIAYAQAGDAAGLWPLLTARFGGTPALAITYLIWRRTGRAPAFSRPALHAGLVIGLLVGVANGLYLLSTQGGLLSIVAAVASLYPAMTIVLAIVLDGERATRPQVVGMLLAAISVVVIVVSR